MRSKFVILVLLACSSKPAFSAENIQLAKAITILKSGDKTKAYSQLEKNYNTQRDNEEKAKIALILAIADQKFIKKNRFEYAEYALRNYRNLEASMALRLTRIAGDGRFDRGDLPIAKKNYQFILAAPSSTQTEKEYATYKLGWIYLNENGAQKAFRLWQNWLEQDSKSDLYQILLHDAGRAWAEAMLSSRSSAKTPSLRLQFRSNEQRLSFFSGIISELNKKTSDQDIVFLLNSLVENNNYHNFLNFILEEKSQVFIARPCALLENLAKADFSIVNIEQTKFFLQACQKQLQKAKDPADMQSMKVLAEIYARLPGFAFASSSKAESFFIASKFDRACLEYTNVVIDQIRKSNKRDSILQDLQKVRLSCGKVSNKVWSHGIEQALRELTEIIFTFKPANEHWNNQALLLANKLNSNNKILALKIYLKNRDQQTHVSSHLVDLLETLVKEKKQSEVKNLLEIYLPLQNIKSLTEINSWAIGGGLNSQSIIGLYTNFFKTINLKKTAENSEMMERSIKILLAERQEKLILQYLDIFNDYFIKYPHLASQLLSFVLGSKEQSLFDLVKKNQLVSFGAILLYSKALVDNAINRSQLNLLESAISEYPEIELLQDLRILVQIKKEEFATKTHSAFQEASLEKLKILVARARAHRWTSLILYKEAQKSIEIISDSIAFLVDALPRKSIIQGFSSKDISNQLRKTRLE